MQVLTAMNTSKKWIFLTTLYFLTVTTSVFFYLRSRVAPHPLLLKPSSVDTKQEILSGIKKALFPLINEGQNLYSSNDFFDLPSTGHLLLSAKHIQKISTPSSPCEKSSFFWMNRKKEKKWKKAYYFTVCQENKTSFVVFWDKKKN